MTLQHDNDYHARIRGALSGGGFKISTLHQASLTTETFGGALRPGLSQLLISPSPTSAAGLLCFAMTEPECRDGIGPLPLPRLPQRRPLPPGAGVPLTAVQGTAMEALGGKMSCVKRGYYEDPYLPLFAPLSCQTMSPLINRGKAPHFRMSLTRTFAMSIHLTPCRGVYSKWLRRRMFAAIPLPGYKCASCRWCRVLCASPCLGADRVVIPGGARARGGTDRGECGHAGCGPGHDGLPTGEGAQGGAARGATASVL
jgi:hypothetical protein